MQQPGFLLPGHPLCWRHLLVVSFTLVLSVTPAPGFPAEAAQFTPKTAKELIDYMEDLYRGNASETEIVMQIEKPQYQRELQLIAWSMGREKSLIRIASPRKEKGISTLKRDSEIWNYFPKIDKVIKVAPSMMMGSWMGSDFTNDDLVKESTLTEDYRLELAESEDKYTVTLIPHEMTVTVWSKIEYTINKALMIPEQQIYYDEKMNRIRILNFLDPKDYNGRLLPSVLEMTPLNKPGNLTRIVYKSILFDPPGVTDETFSLRELKQRF
ncbi:MAG: outer membrane lipoprotein-sorting protein [Gammaproteobacteria bacterium]|nr:outer membrane lipoprotein-sorting protein [Gammaproteobacteria bacterium]